MEQASGAGAWRNWNNPYAKAGTTNTGCEVKVVVESPIYSFNGGAGGSGIVIIRYKFQQVGLYGK